LISDGVLTSIRPDLSGVKRATDLLTYDIAGEEHLARPLYLVHWSGVYPVSQFLGVLSLPSARLIDYFLDNIHALNSLVSIAKRNSLDYSFVYQPLSVDDTPVRHNEGDEGDKFRHWYFPALGWETYLTSRVSKTRKKIRRYIRAAVGYEVQVFVNQWPEPQRPVDEMWELCLQKYPDSYETMAERGEIGHLRTYFSAIMESVGTNTPVFAFTFLFKDGQFVAGGLVHYMTVFGEKWGQLILAISKFAEYPDSGNVLVSLMLKQILDGGFGVHYQTDDLPWKETLWGMYPLPVFNMCTEPGYTALIEGREVESWDYSIKEYV